MCISSVKIDYILLAINFKSAPGRRGFPPSTLRHVHPNTF